MNVLSIGTDRNLFVKESAVRARAIEYGALFDELHVVVFALRGLGLAREQIAPNVWIYPTNSSAKIFYIKDAVRLAEQIAQERGFSAVNAVMTCQDPFETGLVGHKLKKRRGLPLHIQIHTDFLSPFFVTGAGVGANMLNKLRVRIARTVLAQANAVRVVSKRIADSLAAHRLMSASVQLAILPIFVDQEALAHASAAMGAIDLKKKYPQWNRIVLMASRLTKEKNISLGLAVMKKLVQEHPDTGMVIVGAGPEMPRLKATTASLGLSNNVVFETWNNNLAGHFKTADLFLLTSDYEGYGMTIVEALAAGCPVVSTDVGIAPDLLSACPVNDANCLFEKAKTILIDPAERERTVSAACAHVFQVTYGSKAEYLEKYRASIEAAVMPKAA